MSINSSGDGHSSSGNDSDSFDDDSSLTQMMTLALVRVRRRLVLGQSFSLFLGTTSSSHGKARYSEKLKPKKTVCVSANIKVPVSSDFPELFSPDDFDQLDIRIRLERGGFPYAECALDFDHLSEKNNQLYAQYKVDLRKKIKLNKSDSFISKKGSCDTDLFLDGVQNDIPSVEIGDSAIVLETGTGDFLLGDFQ